MAEVHTTVDAVTVKETSVGDLFLVATPDGKFGTLNRDIAEAAKKLLKKAVVIQSSEKDSGRINPYTKKPYPPDLYVNAIEAEGEQMTFDAEPSSNGGGRSPEENLRIMRQSGAKVAVQLLSFFPPAEQTPETLLALSDHLVEYFVNGRLDAGDPVLADDDIPF